MYIVDSGASLHMMGSPSLNDKEKKTIRQSNKIVDIQTANCIVVSDRQTAVYTTKELGPYQLIHLVKDSPSALSLGRLCNDLG